MESMLKTSTFTTHKNNCSLFTSASKFRERCHFVGQIWLQGCYSTVKSELLSVKVIIHFVTYLLSRPLLSLFAC